MTVKFPFLTRVRYFSVETDRVEGRLTSHLERLRSAKANQHEINLTADDEAKIRRRAKFIRNLRQGYVSARSLKNEDRVPLKKVSPGVALNGPVTVHEVDNLGPHFTKKCLGCSQQPKRFGSTCAITSNLAVLELSSLRR